MACVRIEQTLKCKYFFNQKVKKDLYKKATVKGVETTRQQEKALLWVSQTGNRFRCIDSLEPRPHEDETDEAYAQVYGNGGKGSTKLRQRSRLVAVCRAQSTTTGAVATRPNSSVVWLQHKMLVNQWWRESAPSPDAPSRFSSQDAGDAVDCGEKRKRGRITAPAGRFAFAFALGTYQREAPLQEPVP